MFEFILEIVAEIILQLIVEVLADCGIQVFKKKPTRNPLAAGIGYFLFGVITGFLSLLVFEKSFIADPSLRIANLIIAPTLAGLAMAWIGKLRSKRGSQPIRLERFSYGFLFAFAISLVRLIWSS